MKAVLIQHGEKIALLLVVLISAYAVYGTYTDPKAQPRAGADEEGIDAATQVISRAKGESPPTPKALVPYAETMSKRFKSVVQSQPVSAFLQSARIS